MIKIKHAIKACALALTVLASPAAAQSSCQYIATGAILTAAQWNACFAAKQNTLGFVPVNRAGDSMLGKLTAIQSSAVTSGFNLPQGAAPTNPVNGDIWTTLSGIYVRINGITVGPLASASAVAFAATAPITVSFPSNVVTYDLSIDPNFSVGAGALTLAAGGIAYPSSVSGGAKGAGTINASALYVNGVAVSGAGITSLSADVVATGPGAAAATIQPNVVSYSKFQQVAASSLVGNPTGSLANAQGITLGSTLAFSGTALQTSAMSGDLTTPANSFVTTLATVNSNVGSCGSATTSSVVTLNGKGLATACASTTVTPAIGSITGLGTGVATALGINVGTAGAFVANGGALGTPSSGVATNLTGTASGLTAGTVTTNANLTGDVTSTGNATTIASGVVSNAKLATAAAYTFKGNATGSTAAVTDFTIAGLPNKASPTGSDLVIISDAAASNATKYSTVTQLLGSVVSGVSSIAGNTGAFTLSTGITNSTNDIRLDKATAANLAAGTSNKAVTADIAVSAALPVALTPGATVTPDLNTGFNFTLTPNQNFTLANPSNITGKEGREFCVAITNDSTPRTITYGTSYFGPGGSSTQSLTASAGALDQLCGFIVSTTQINIGIGKAYAH